MVGAESPWEDESAILARSTAALIPPPDLDGPGLEGRTAGLPLRSSMRLANLALSRTRRISPLAFVSMLVSCTTAAVAIYAWSSLVHGQRVHLRASIGGVARECAD